VAGLSRTDVLDPRGQVTRPDAAGAAREVAVSAIVVSYNTRERTLACIASLARDPEPAAELIVVDNDSADGTSDALASAYPAVRIQRQTENLGFARACNLGARTARGRYLAFFNSDCIVEPGCLSRLTAFLDSHPRASVAVPRLVSASGVAQANVAHLPSVRSIASEHLLGHIPRRYPVARLTQPTRVDAFSGAALLIRRKDFSAVGGFHEAYFMYMEDVELSRRLAADGRLAYYIPEAVAYHEEGGSSREIPQALLEIHMSNYRDYVRRTMGPARRTAALAALRLGMAITPARDTALAAVRRWRANGPAATENSVG
jgi:N-acetylglucosaminyl-diphospho-decaprenol L-rhamnosyltransferase